MYSSQTLDKIRQNIDRIDNTVHDLLMERAALAENIAAAKKERGMPIVHPAREARMIRRLINRHEGRLPKSVIARIWRELVCAVSMLQSGLSAEAYAPDLGVDSDLTIRNYFGSVLPLRYRDDSISTLKSLKNGDSDFAILPYPLSQYLLDIYRLLSEGKDNQNNIKVVQSLPFIKETKNQETEFLVLSKGIYESSDDDCSYVLTLSNTPVAFDNDKVIKVTTAEYSGQNLTLFEFAEYLDEDSDMVSELKTAAGNDCEIYMLGGYPSPIILE